MALTAVCSSKAVALGKVAFMCFALCCVMLPAVTAAATLSHVSASHIAAARSTRGREPRPLDYHHSPNRLLFSFPVFSEPDPKRIE